MNENSESRKLLAESVFKATQTMCQFVVVEVLPVIKQNGSTTERQSILWSIFYKMYLHMEALSKLDHKLFYQTVASSSRSIFEHFLDMHCLVNDKTGECFSRYKEFPQIARYYAAKKIVENANEEEMKKKQCFIGDTFFSKAREEMRRMEAHDLKNKIEKKCWGRKPGFYWHGTSYERFSIDLSLYDDYLMVYPYYSWFVHSGPTGFDTLKEDTMEGIFYYAHISAQDYFMKSIEVIDKEFEMSKKINDFDTSTERLRLMVKQYFFDGCFKNMVQKHRPSN